MITLGEFSRLVSAIHAAAIAPAHWEAAMAAIGPAFGAPGSALTLADGSTRVVKNASIAPDALQSYTGHYRQLDYVLEAVENGPVGLIRDGQSLIALNPRSEFNIDWMRPYDMDDGVFVRVTDGPQPACFLVPAPLRDEAFASAERVELASALVPHIQQALRTERYLDDLKRDAEDVACAVDSMRHATLVVGPNAALVHMNSAAERILARDDGICVHAGRLAAAAGHAAGGLQRGVAAALGSTEGGARRGSSLVCPKSSAERGYVVHVIPFTSRGSSSQRALVVIVDPERQPEPPKALLRNLFGLTNAEADVALRVARGHGLAPIADELSLSLATVKSHLQRVFDKTDTHRQAELVRLLAAITG